MFNYRPPGPQRGGNPGFDMLGLTSFPVARRRSEPEFQESRFNRLARYLRALDLEIVKSKVAEILICGIPEASGLRGSIRLVKLVSHLLARAHNLSYGPTYTKHV